MRSVILYTAARLALFGVTVGVLYLAGARGFLLLALAVLISGILSFVVLSRQRDAVSASVVERAARMRERLAEGAAREDEDEPAAGEPTVGEPARGEPAAGEPTAGEPAPGVPSLGETKAGDRREVT